MTYAAHTNVSRNIPSLVEGSNVKAWKPDIVAPLWRMHADARRKTETYRMLKIGRKDVHNTDDPRMTLHGI